MNKTTRVSVIAGLALALASGAALAQTKKPAAPPVAAPKQVTSSSGGIGEGDTELGFFGSINDSDIGTISLLGFTFGKYISDDLELRLTQTLAFADAGGVTTVAWIPYGSAEYQLRQGGSPFVPYVGGGAGVVLVGSDDFFISGLFVTPVAGVKYFLNERTSLEYALSYQFSLLGQYCDDFDCFDADVATLANSVRINIYY